MGIGVRILHRLYAVLNRKTMLLYNLRSLFPIERECPMSFALVCKNNSYIIIPINLKTKE